MARGVAARLALGDQAQDARDPHVAVAGGSCRGARRRALNGARPSAPRVCGPTTPSTSRPLRRWKRLTARSVWGPNTPSAGMPRARLDAPDGGSAVTAFDHQVLRARGLGRAGHHAVRLRALCHAGQRQRGESGQRERFVTHGIDDRLHFSAPFRCLRGELTGSRWKVRYAVRLGPVRDSPQKPELRVGPPLSAAGTTETRQVFGNFEAAIQADRRREPSSAACRAGRRPP